MPRDFMQVDAFTTQPLGGNPCAIVFDADDLDTQTMQALAKENNLSETAFVLQSDVADVRARYFTPDEGNPTGWPPHHRHDLCLGDDRTVAERKSRTPRKHDPDHAAAPRGNGAD